VTEFLQLHLLTSYPPSNPNRDDLHRPKTAIIGGRVRQRISSQAIKRAIRVSDAFVTALAGHMGERTQRLGDEILEHLLADGILDDKARDIARGVVEVFGKLEESERDSEREGDGDKKGSRDKKGRTKEKPDSVRIRQLAFISPEEKRLAFKLADEVAAGEELPKDKDLVRKLLRAADGAVDIAMFGRMLANNQDYNRDAAVQVAHAFTTNAVEIEDDYYTAVDDLKKPADKSGAGFVGEAGFGSGIYYLYVCVNHDLLIKNLAGDRALSSRGLDALVRAVSSSSPSGKRNSFANHVRAEFILAEWGDQQPRSLAGAFTTPVGEGDQLEISITRLLDKRKAFAKIYGQDWREERILHVGAPDSATLSQVAAFVAASLGKSR